MVRVATWLVTKYAASRSGVESERSALATSTGAPLASPTFTGIPRAPNPPVGTNTSQISTTAWGISQQQVVHVEDYIPSTANVPAAIQAAINAAQASGKGGGIQFQYGKTYVLSAGSIPTFAPGVPLDIDLNCATIQLSATIPTPWLPNRTADHQTFTARVHDGFIDRNNVTGANTVVLGSWTGGAFQLRVNWYRATVERVVTLNVPNSGGQSMAVAIGNRHLNGGEATQNTLLHTVVRDCVFNGGAQGVWVGSNGATNPGHNVNVYVDHTTIERCWHSCYGVPAPAAHIQIGSQAQGGFNNVIRDCYGEGAPDVGIETNAVNKVLIENTTVVDAANACLYANNYNTPEFPAAQTLIYRNCVAKYVTRAPGLGFWHDNNSGLGGGHVYLERCRVEISQATAPNASSGWFWEVNGVPLRGLTITDFVGEAQGFTWNNAGNSIGNYFARTVLAQTGGVTPIFTLRDARFLISGTQAGTGQLQGTILRIFGVQKLNIDGVRIGWNITNTGGGSLNGTLTGMDVGGVAGSVIDGTIQRLRFDEGLSDAAPTAGISYGSGANLSIPNRLNIEKCDFSSFAGGTEILGAAAQKAKIFMSGIVWRVFPRAASAQSTSNFTAATFTTATGNQYLGGQRATIHFAKGAGTTTTAIARSIDGATYFNVYEQAAGVLANDVVFQVNPGDYVKVTDAGGPPTCTVLWEQ